MAAQDDSTAPGRRRRGRRGNREGSIYLTRDGRWRGSLGLPRIRQHDLRHLTASILLERGVPARVVADLFGHFSITLTLDTYIHVTTRHLQRALDIMVGLGSQRRSVALSPETVQDS